MGADGGALQIGRQCVCKGTRLDKRITQEIYGLRTRLSEAVIETFSFRVEAVLAAVTLSPQVHYTLLGRGIEAPLEKGLSAHIQLARLDASLCRGIRY